MPRDTHDYIPNDEEADNAQKLQESAAALAEYRERPVSLSADDDENLIAEEGPEDPKYKYD